MKQTLFYQDKPLFGLDIGHSSVRVMELVRTKAKKGKNALHVNGYGAISFPSEALENGVIVKPEVVAEAVLKLFRHDLIGSITTKRVALSLPTSHMFTRIMEVPQDLSAKDVTQAVHNEAEQYIPVPLSDLYIDYTPIHRSKSDQNELFIVATPKRIVDSYIMLCHILGLEPILLEPSIGSSVRVFGLDEQSDVPAILIDFGSESADITVYDKELVVSGTVPCGGETFTRLIADALKVTAREAETIKAKYGLNASKKQENIRKALQPTLDMLIKEVRRTMRYYEEREGNEHTVGQVVMIGGGASMPGLVDYITSSLRLPARTLDPTAYLEFGKLQPISLGAHTSYITVAGLGMVDPTGVFA